MFIVTCRPLEVPFIPGAITYWLYLYWAEGMLDMIFSFLNDLLEQSATLHHTGRVLAL